MTMPRTTRSKEQHPRLPYGFGSIRYLGMGRTQPYAVHPPRRLDGVNDQSIDDAIADRKRSPALCYVKDWFTGLVVLAAWHAGVYQEGLELGIERELITPGRNRLNQRNTGWTVEEAWKAFYEWKFGRNAVKKLADSTEENYQTVWKKLSSISTRKMDSLTIDDLQAVVNESGTNITIVSKTLQLIKELYKFALPREGCRRNIAQYVVMPDTEGPEHYRPFTDEELKVLWRQQDDPVVKMILIMCYSGFRIGAWRQISTNLEEGFFQGGIKTKSGKNRIVPIHSAIRPLVRDMLEKHGGYFGGVRESQFRRDFKRKMKELGIDGCTDDTHDTYKSEMDGVGMADCGAYSSGVAAVETMRDHKPHSCRHTFSRLCESYGVLEADRKRMMGHSFGKDITNGVYGHRTLEELREQIEKIKV